MYVFYLKSSLILTYSIDISKILFFDPLHSPNILIFQQQNNYIKMFSTMLQANPTKHNNKKIKHFRFSTFYG